MSKIRFIISTIVVTCVLLCVAEAQNSPATALPDGLLIPVRLLNTVNAKTPVGTAIKLEVTTDVKDKKGVVVIPQGAMLMGKVTKAIPYSKETKESVLSVVADDATWKHGHAVLNAYIVGKMHILNSTIKVQGASGVLSGVNGSTSVEDSAAASSMSTGAPLSNDKIQGPYKDRAVDQSVRLRMSTDPNIVTEVFSNDHDVQIDAASSFMIRNVVTSH